MATDGGVALAKSASLTMLELLLSPGSARQPLPNLDEIRKILELGQERREEAGEPAERAADAR